jgi:hypothetical protein
MARAFVTMCEIEIFYTDGTSQKHDILLWDWFQHRFPTDDRKEVKEVKRGRVYRMEMD